MTASMSPWAALLPPAAHTPDGLETLTDVLVALSDGAPVPQRAAEHLAQALRPCLTGDNDIAGRLGLRAPGRRSGARGVGQSRRLPGRAGQRGPPTQIAHGRRGIGDAQPRFYASGGKALHLAIPGGNKGVSG